MGQGLFGAIGFGAILTAKQENALYGKDGWSFPDIERPRSAYESEKSYVAYLIFDNAGYSANGYDERYAVPLDKLTNDTKRRYPEAYKLAKKNWLALRRAAKKIGIDLPIGGLIYVHDYD